MNRRFFFTSQEPAPVDDIALLTVRGQKPQCYECKKYGHVARNCRQKLFFNYCKRNGHVISECTRRPQSNIQQTAQVADNEQVTMLRFEI